MSEKSREHLDTQPLGDQEVQNEVERLRNTGHQVDITEDSSEYHIRFDDHITHVTKVGNSKEMVDLIREVVEKSNENKE